MEVKEDFKGTYCRPVGRKYMIRDGYRLLLGVQEKKRWHRQISNRGNIPKFCFIFWLAVQNRLRTKDRLAKHMILQEDNCVLCEKKVEYVQHLFFSCKYSRKCLLEVKRWSQWKAESEDMWSLIRWIQRS